jgi:mRNA interferase RelE/StbE
MADLVLSSGAEKAMAKLQKSDSRLFRRISTALEHLASEPFAGKALVGPLKGYYSERVGDYRILYTLENGSSHVLVLKIQHRKEVYR